MILKALYDYYHRNGTLPPLGFTLKRIRFIIVIDNDGKLKRVEDRGKDASFMVVKGANNVTSAVYSNVFYGKSKYIINFDPKTCKISNSPNKWFADNLNKVNSIVEHYPDNQDFLSVKKFYDNGEYKKIEKLDIWAELSKVDELISFQMQGKLAIVAERCEDLDDYVKEFYLNDIDVSKGKEMRCLISGKKGKPVLASTMTPMRNAGKGKLVSFKDKKGFDSYGKLNGLNAPFTKESEFYCFTALQHLMRADSDNKYMLGDNRLFLFWASSNNERCNKAKSFFQQILGLGNKDNPDRRVDLVFKTINSIFSGKEISNDNDKFYILGLAPFNDARIGVTYWNEIEIDGFAMNIKQHFEDMDICNNNVNIGLFRIIEAISVKSSDNKRKAIQPNISESVIKSIINGTSYPYSLFTACLRRIRAEIIIKKDESKKAEDIFKVRAAILKAYLNRQKNNNNKKIEKMLDKTNDNIGYLCGRLFATLVRIEQVSKNNYETSSIRERYMNSASTTPAAVFANLLNLSIHHEEKLTPGRKVQFERVKSEIVEKISGNGFPAHLDINDQARFFVGYYHQRQDFFTKKEDKNSND